MRALELAAVVDAVVAVVGVEAEYTEFWLSLVDAVVVGHTGVVLTLVAAECIEV